MRQTIQYSEVFIDNPVLKINLISLRFIVTDIIFRISEFCPYKIVFALSVYFIYQDYVQNPNCHVI